MSLILEALRKSEAERQRGRAPGLFVEQEVLRRSRRQVPAWLAWVGTAALLLVLAAWAWREYARDPAAPARTPQAAATPAAAPVPTADGMPPPPVPAAGTAISPAPGATSGPTIDAATAELPPSTPQPLEPTPLREPEPVATVDTAVAPPAVAPQPAPVPDFVAPPPLAAVDAATPASPPATSASPDDPALPRLADLPASERAALPPLKLSMHVYSDEPERRFVILDGQRLTEGAAPAAGVVLEQIRRDGAVLSINGRSVLVARP